MDLFYNGVQFFWFMWNFGIMVKAVAFLNSVLISLIPGCFIHQTFKQTNGIIGDECRRGYFDQFIL